MNNNMRIAQNSFVIAGFHQVESKSNTLPVYRECSFFVRWKLWEDLLEISFLSDIMKEKYLSALGYLFDKLLS